MSIFTQTRASKIAGLAIVVLLAGLIAPVAALVRASNSNHIIDVNIACDVQPEKNPSGFITGWHFSVSGSQVNGPTTQVKIHMPWAPYAVEGPGSGTHTEYTSLGSTPPNTWTASAETFQQPGWAGSLTQCNFDVPPQEPSTNPELSVLKTGPATATADTDITYSITAKNSGNGDAHGVSVSDVYDQQKLSFVSASNTACQPASNGSPIVLCTIGTLPAGQTRTITFTFHIKPTAACTQISNKAEMGAQETVAQPWSMITTNVACPVPTLVCAPANQTVNVNQTATVSATGGNGTYAWTATAGTPATGTGSSFSTKYTTSGAKTISVISAGQTATCGVTVNTPPPQVVCTPATQTVNVNQAANFSATGGNGTYAWVAANGSPANGTGTNFSTSYTTAGNKSVTVTSAGQTATCAVVVSIPTAQLVCTPATQTVNVNQAATFSATGGTGTYAWTAVSGAPASGSGATFSTAYTTQGTKSVQVTSGNQTATCTAIVNTPVQPQLICTPGVQTVNVNQAAVVSATGGNGTYSWVAPGASSANLNGQNVSIVYTSAGTRTVTVNSGNQSAVCTIVVNQVNQNTTLSITKLVRNVTQQGTFAENISNVKPGDVLEYQIRIRNTGSVNANAVQLADFINQANLLTDFRGFTASRGFTGQLHNGTINFAESLAPNAEILVGYTYTAVTGMNNATTVCNTATASSSNSGTTSDVACVTGSTGTVNLVLSKSAWNDTKNVDATTKAASREDYITYKLTVRNTGTTDALNYVFSDDLSGVLPLADVADLGGGTITGQTITYPALTIPANGTVTKTFRVRIKFFLSPSISYQMINTFGNTITVVINPPTPYVPPRTGGYIDLLTGVGFAGLLTSAFVLHRKKNIFRLIFT